jgi:site-specific recombinase XerD
MNDLQSALAQPIADFLHYKQALNKKYQTETLALRLFDSYLFGQGITGWQAVTSSVIDAFMASRSRHRPRSYNHLLGVLRRFFDWAVLQRWINQNPVVQRSKRETGKRLPYLFDLTKARRLLAVAVVS